MPRQSESFHGASAKKATAAHAPLAERMRPRTIDEFVGQEHLLGRGHVLRDMIESGRVESLILWGPPGSGKTTLAHLLAAASGAPAVSFSAVLQGVKELRQIIDEAEVVLERSGQPTVLFVDEIHRFNKAQQDAFLPHVEAGTITLIGATTENPSFEVIAPLLSRTRVLTLEPLGDAEIGAVIDRALADPERGLGRQKLALDAEAQALQVAVAAKDAVHFVGLPEGRIPLAQAATFLATCPKSNAAYQAMLRASEEVRASGALPVPLHLRNAPTLLMKGLGYGADYRYPHDHPDAVVDQEYLPERLAGRRYYEPTDRGREREIGERLRGWRGRREPKPQ